MTKIHNGPVYLDPPYTVTVRELAWQRAGLQQTATGYGRKLTTRYVLAFPDARGRVWRYRVYAVCYSNCASYYVIRGGVPRYLRDHELQAAVDAARA